MSTKPTGSHQLPSTSTPLPRPQWPRLYGIGSAASCPAVEDGATATPKNSPGEVAIVPSSAAALTLMSDRLAVRSLEDDLPRRSKRERVGATGLRSGN